MAILINDTTRVPVQGITGYAGAIVSMGAGKANAKIRELEETGVQMCRSIRYVTEAVSSIEGPAQ